MVTSCSSVPQQQLTEDQLHQIRLYLALCRMLQYTLSDDIKKVLTSSPCNEACTHTTHGTSHGGYNHRPLLLGTCCPCGLELVITVHANDLCVLMSKFVQCIRVCNGKATLLILLILLSFSILQNLEEDFVLMRRSDSSVTAEVFHHLLGVSRLVALSRGSAQLTMDHWTHTKHLEALRSNRHN